MGIAPMFKIGKNHIAATLLSSGLLGSTCIAAAAVSIDGQVIIGGAPVAGSTVTLWEADANAPTQLAQARTGNDGGFRLHADGKGAILYVVAKGGQVTPTMALSGQASGPGSTVDNPAIALLTVLGSSPPSKVVINELTTVASAFTSARFLNGDALSGNPLGLRIAAGNAPNLVDPATGGWGKVLLDPLNSSMTTT
jgi:hypothetical protein